MSQKNGSKYQLELLRTYQTACDTGLDGGGHETDAEILRFRRARSSLCEARRRGWQLTMTAELSPADRVGIDFVWEHPLYGWYPIDCTAMYKGNVPRLINLATVESASTQDGGGVALLSRIEFVELLVRLSRETPFLTRSLIEPPDREAARDSEAEAAVRNFQRKLEELSRGAGGALCREWAERLNKAVGYFTASRRGVGTFNAAVVQSAIDDGVEQFFAIVSSGRSLPVNQMSLSRGRQLTYSPNQDTLYLGDTSYPELRGFSTAAQQRFEARYLTMVQGGRFSEEMIQVKRLFSSNGLQFVVHFVLDRLAEVRDGKSGSASQPRRTAVVVRPVVAPVVKNVRKERPPVVKTVAPVSPDPRPLASCTDLGGVLRDFAAFKQRRQARA